MTKYSFKYHLVDIATYGNIKLWNHAKAMLSMNGVHKQQLLVWARRDEKWEYIVTQNLINCNDLINCNAG